MVNYRPYEQTGLDALIPALNHGMDPTIALQLFQGIQGGAIQRAEERRAQNQAMMQAAMGQMQNYASDPYATMNGLNSLADSYQAVIPALAKPKFDARLEDLVGSLQPLAAMKPPPPDPTAEEDPGPALAGQAQPLTNEELAGVHDIASQAAAAASAGVMADPKSGAKTDLHSVRMNIMASYRAQGYSEAELAQLYDVIGRAYQAAGAPRNAPVTYANRLESLANPQSPARPAGAAASAAQAKLGPYLGILDQLMPKDPTLGTAANPSWLPTWLNGDAMLHPQAHGMQSWADALNPFS